MLTSGNYSTLYLQSYIYIHHSTTEYNHERKRKRKSILYPLYYILSTLQKKGLFFINHNFKKQGKSQLYSRYHRHQAKLQLAIEDETDQSKFPLTLYIVSDQKCDLNFNLIFSVNVQRAVLLQQLLSLTKTR